MSASPHWSVVVPTFRRHDALGECLARLAPGAQSLDAGSYEVLVTDDARSPETRAFVESRFPWARWLVGPSRGPAANRNAGAAAARGSWIAFTDDDTLPSREWLAAFDAAVLTDPTTEALEGRTTCPGGFGSPLYYAPVNETGGRFWSCNIAVRAARFRDLGGFDEGFTVPHMEDQDLRERLRAAGARIVWVPGAHVEHPRRRQPDGRRLGMLRAAEVRYRYKHGAPRPVRWRLLYGIVRLRLGIIRSLPWGRDSIAALRSLATELWTVHRHIAEWERAARAEFPRTGGPRAVLDSLSAPRGPRKLFPARPIDREDASPSVSVVVPTWARTADLHRCLTALARQSRLPDEVIVVTRTDDEPSRVAARGVRFPAGCELILPRVDRPGVVAALELGVELARGDLLAFTDDDAEPRPDWLARCVGALEHQRDVGGVGGRDWQPHERGAAPVVGRVRWPGRVIGRHHLGVGPARDVDVLKGVNAVFRAPLVRAVGIDHGLRGGGAQVHWELALCLPMRRAGWRLVYDPSIAVEHHVAARASDDQVHRGSFAEGPFGDAAFNQENALLAHLGAIARLVHLAWGEVVGTSASPGLLAAVRLRAQGHRWAGAAWRVARRARADARSDRRDHGVPPRWIPVPGSLR